jgi:preprotein translocase subunit SecG
VICAAVAAAAKGALKAVPSSVQHITPQVVQAPPAQQPVTWFQQHASWATHGIAGIFIIAAVGLVILLAVQTTKQEGLSGTIGGRVSSDYRGRLGFDGQIARVTGVVAITFVVVATLVSLSGI